MNLLNLDESVSEALQQLAVKGQPRLVAHYNDRIAAIAQILQATEERVGLLVSRLVVAQMLPDEAVIKGGFGIKLRVGEIGSRATKDLDVATLRGPGGTDLRAAWIQDLATALAEGWGSAPASKKALRNDQNAPVRVAFRGSIRPGRVASPDEVPPRYVMTPHHVT